MKTLNLITLGCSKNTVDSERICAQLVAGGWRVVFDSPEPAADVVVINTCGFIGDAKEESVNMILQCAAARERGEIGELYVIGCLSQRYADELRVEIPEVDRFFGVRDLSEVVRHLAGGWRDELTTTRRLSTPPHYAYLKISEGCDRACGYCAIPMIRGGHVSVPMEQLEEEARLLAAGGVKELIVIAQDTTYYGLDIYGERRLAELLRSLCRIEGIEWVRLHYAFPAQFPWDVAEVIAREPKMCKYLDIPLQHITDSQLVAMRRGHGRADTERLIERLRAEIPGITLRTTFIVGHPGETEEDFRQLCDFAERARFERLGVFPYSEEEGTRSAEKLVDDVPQQEKERRTEVLMRLQGNISLEKNVSKVGSVQRVIVDGREGDFYVGRSQYDSPEVDQEILFTSGSRLFPGDFALVEITSAEQYDLYGESAEGEHEA